MFLCVYVCLGVIRRYNKLREKGGRIYNYKNGVCSNADDEDFFMFSYGNRLSLFRGLIQCSF